MKLVNYIKILLLVLTVLSVMGCGPATYAPTSDNYRKLPILRIPHEEWNAKSGQERIAIEENNHVILTGQTSYYKDSSINDKIDDPLEWIIKDGKLDIDIKGIRIGMTKSEYRGIIGTNKYFTVAGVNRNIKGGTTDPFYMDYSNDKATVIIFSFKPRYFSKVHNAIKRKYPNLTCLDSTVGNRIGASFTQIDCVLIGRLGVLRLEKYHDLDTSYLSLYAHHVDEKYKKESREDLDDI